MDVIMFGILSPLENAFLISKRDGRDVGDPRPDAEDFFIVFFVPFDVFPDLGSRANETTRDPTRA